MIPLWILNLRLKFIVIFLVLLEYHSALANNVYYPWMYYLPYGRTVTLRPLFRNETNDFVTIRSCKWLTPKQIELNPDMLNYDVTRYGIDKARCELTIYNNQKDTNGVYHCVINDYLISKAMLNVHGAPKSNLLEQYRPNLIAGFSTFGAIIALFAFACGINKYKYRELPSSSSNGKKYKKANNNIKLESLGGEYTNDGFNAEISETNNNIEIRI
jgi:hypothetical protein